MDYNELYGFYYEYDLQNGYSSNIIEGKPYLTEFINEKEIYLEVTTHVPFMQDYKFTGFTLIGTTKGLFGNDIFLHSGERINILSYMNTDQVNKSNNENIEISFILRANYERITEKDKQVTIQFHYDYSFELEKYEYKLLEENTTDVFNEEKGYVIPASCQSTIIGYFNTDDDFIMVYMNRNYEYIKFIHNNEIDYVYGTEGSDVLTILGFSDKCYYKPSNYKSYFYDMPYRVTDPVFYIPFPYDSYFINLYAYYSDKAASRITKESSASTIAIVNDMGKETVLSSYHSSMNHVLYDLSTLSMDEPLLAGYSTKPYNVTPEYRTRDIIILNTTVITSLYAVHADMLTELTVVFLSEDGTTNIPLPIKVSIPFEGNVMIPDIIPKRDGYIFDGWVTEDNRIHYPLSKLPVTLSAIGVETVFPLNARWKTANALQARSVANTLSSNDDNATLLADNPFAVLNVDRDLCSSVYVKINGHFRQIL